MTHQTIETFFEWLAIVLCASLILVLLVALGCDAFQTFAAH